MRGSYLELMLGLEDLEDGVGMTPLIVHVPGHTENSIAETPLFELYRAGRRQFCLTLPERFSRSRDPASTACRIE